MIKFKKKWFKCKFKIKYRQTKEQLCIERRKLWKHFIFVVKVIKRRKHEYDSFSQCLFEVRGVLNLEARVTPNKANNRYNLRLIENWFFDAEISCPEEFTIINMAMC
jgi:hypothetical protein